MPTDLLPPATPTDPPAETHRGPFQITSSRQVYDNPWITVTEYQVITPAGTPGLYGCLTHKTRATAVLAIDPDGCLLLIRQYRFQMQETSIDIIQGGVPKGETLLAAAKRELQEEAGLQAHHWQEVERFTSCNGVGDKTGGTYLAWGLHGDGIPSLDDEEELEVLRVPLEQAFDMVQSGEIADICSRAAISRLQIMLLSGQLEDRFWQEG